MFSALMAFAAITPFTLLVCQTPARILHLSGLVRQYYLAVPCPYLSVSSSYTEIVGSLGQGLPFCSACTAPSAGGSWSMTGSGALQ